MLAGGVLLGSLPLGLGVIFVTAGHDEEGGSRAAQVFLEAGPWGYAVVAGVLLASVLAALMVGLSEKRPALLPVAVLAFAFPLLAGVVGGALDLRSLSEAVLDASPADQLAIIAGSTAERIELTRITTLLVGTSWMLVALGALLTLGAGHPLQRLGVTGTAGLFGLSSFALAFHAMQTSSVFRAMAYAGPGDGAQILGPSLLESEPSHFAGLALLAIGVLLAIASGAIALRTSPSMGAAMLVGCLGGGVALATLEVRSRHDSFFVPEGIGSRLVADAVELNGSFSGHEGFWLEPGDSPERIDQRVRENAEDSRNAAQNVVVLGVTKSSRRGDVVRVLERASEAGFEVELLGRRPVEAVEAPAHARRFVGLLGESMQSVRVALRPAGEACEDCVGTAKVSGANLEVTPTGEPTETWELGDDRDSYGRPPRLDYEWTGGVDELVRAASLAFSHRHALSIAVPSAE